MIPVIGTIVSWFAKSGVASIGDQLNKAYQAKLNAKNQKERVEADILIEQLRTQQAIVIAEQQNWLTRGVRPAIAYPFAFYLAKILIWDKCFGLGSTPDIPQHMWYMYGGVMTAYFGVRPFEKWLLRK